MRYIPIVLLFLILDLVLLITVIGLLVVVYEENYPLSYKFACKVWGFSSDG